MLLMIPPVASGECDNGGGGGGNEDWGIDDAGFGKYEGDDRLKMQRYRKNNPSFCRIQG